MSVPLAEGNTFNVPFVIGIVVSRIIVGPGAAAVLDAPGVKEIAAAHQVEQRIVAPEVAVSRPVSHPTTLFR